jgi:uncharacterized caspase-like protein
MIQRRLTWRLGLMGVASVFICATAFAQVQLTSPRSVEAKSVGTVLPPVVSIQSPADGSSATTSPIEVRYLVRSPEPATAITVLVDGRPVEIGKPKELSSSGNDRIASVSVPLPQHDSVISLVAHAGEVVGEAANVHLVWKGDQRLEKPELYALLVGVSQYQDASLNNLRFAAKDAIDVADVLRQQKGGVYKDVHLKVLTDKDATRNSILDGFDWLQKSATDKDATLVFLFGHGVTRSGTYYLFPTETDLNRFYRTTVSGDEIRQLLSRTPGRVILFTDTCSYQPTTAQTTKSTVDVDRFANELISEENGIVVMSSCSGHELPLQSDLWQHGAFAKALIEGLSGQAEEAKSGVITVDSLEQWLSGRMVDLTASKQHPFSAIPRNMADFPIAFIPRTPNELQGPTPQLEIISPNVSRGTVSISTTDTELTGRVQPVDNVFLVLVDTNRVDVDDAGKFHSTLHLSRGTNKFTVTAIGRDHTVQSTIISIEHSDQDAQIGTDGNSYAVVIGEQQYKRGEYDSLNTPRSDATEVSMLLHDRFGFRTTIDLPGRPNVTLLLLDKNRDEILELIEDVGSQIRPMDNLLIYYAGHGKRSDQRGYWIPSSADKDRLHTFIIDDEVSEEITQMKAKHILVVSDSCYSSALYRSEGDNKETAEENIDRSHYLEDASARMSRRLLTSGSDEPVEDNSGNGHSVFADEFLDALRTMQPNPFTDEELYIRLKPKVLSRAKQTPTTRAIPNVGDRDGHLIFKRVDYSRSESGGPQ